MTAKRQRKKDIKDSNSNVILISLLKIKSRISSRNQKSSLFMMVKYLTSLSILLAWVESFTFHMKKNFNSSRSSSSSSSHFVKHYILLLPTFMIKHRRYGHRLTIVSILKSLDLSDYLRLLDLTNIFCPLKHSSISRRCRLGRCRVDVSRDAKPSKVRGKGKIKRSLNNDFWLIYNHWNVAQNELLADAQENNKQQREEFSSISSTFISSIDYERFKEKWLQSCVMENYIWNFISFVSHSSTSDEWLIKRP